MQLLTQSIEEFLTSIEQQKPPDVFVAKGLRKKRCFPNGLFAGKLLILAAHKFVYIGDTVAQCVHSTAVSKAMRQMSDAVNICV